MRYGKIPSSLFIENRNRFKKQLKPNSLALFNSNDVHPTNSDGTMPFIQNSDLFYLTGINQEESMLLIFPNCQEPKHREILFLKEPNELLVTWEGEKLSKERAFEVSGIKTVYWLHEFGSIFNALLSESEFVYLNTNEHLRANIRMDSRDIRFIKWCKEKYPLHKYERLAPIMHRLRAVKSEGEISLISKAISITGAAFRRVASFIKPGVKEYEIEAELTHEFLRNCSRGSAYSPIIASGANACVLHYIDNNKPCRKGDVLLMDFGAEYANYASDLTRCVPVSGKFTKRQCNVYNAVLRVMKGAKKLLLPGIYMKEYHREVGRLMEKELVDLGLLKARTVLKARNKFEKTAEEEKDDSKLPYKKYFMHGTSHFLGLDVHDVGLWHEPVEAGMVFTCEPGIYIPEEKLGIRLENNILVTEGGAIDLTADIPLEAEDIEGMMKS